MTKRTKNKGSIGEIFKRQQLSFPKRRHDSNAPLCNIIDGMGLAHAAFNAYGKLSFQGNSTAIVFGVPQMIKSTLQRYPCKKLIVCWDGVKHPKRMELLPEYKGHRLKKRDPEERRKFEEQIADLRKLLFRMGIPQAYDPNVEGDDMLYMVQKEMIKLYRINIISGDKDFYQLINYDCSVYNPRTNSPFSAFGCPSDFPCELPQFIDYLCLVGDESDDIPGYRGCGPKTAEKFLKAFGSIKTYLDSNKEFAGLNDKDKLREIYRRNRRLIDLELFCRKYYPQDYKFTYYKDKSCPNFNEVKYRTFCLKYNLKTMLYPKFMEPFKNL